MTGFGRGEAENASRSWSVEVRGVNNRFLDLKIKLPRGYNALEDRVRAIVGEYFQRGRVDLAISVHGDFSDLVEINVNTELAIKYRDALDEIAKICGVDGVISAEKIAQFPDVITRDQRVEDVEVDVWPYLEQAVRLALVGCEEMRAQEGASLREDLLGRLAFFTQTIDEIEANGPKLVEQRQTAMQERLVKLLDNVALDPQRLAQEVAILADKTDITEEIVRLRSHIAQFTAFMGEGVAVGRKLDFLIQEFLREVNTIASKINDASVAHLTVNLKSELEKMREQVQNIE